MAKKQAAKLIGIDWNFSELMNESIRCFPQRPIQKRSHIYASELGGMFVDRYLKMHAHTYSNPVNDRGRRKFISGDIFEWIVYLILTVTGVLKQKQLRGEVELPGLLRVSGRLDFIAGGDVDWDKAKEEVIRLKSMFGIVMSEMPPIIFYSVDRIMFRMEQMFTRVPLKEIILECKSVSGFVGDLIEKTNKPRPGHPFQTLHYVLANKIDGSLLYVNKDSFMLYQFDILPTRQMLKEYKQDVQSMTDYYNNSGRNYLKNLPPKEPEVNFIEEKYQFVKNNHVEYSPYLTMLYGYKDFDDFKLKWQKPIASWNRTFRRCVLAAKMTDLNKQVISEVTKIFPAWDMYVQKARKAGAFLKPETEDEE